jgi:hypothetical protein
MATFRKLTTYNKNILIQRYFPCNFLRVMLHTWRLFVLLTCTNFSSLYNTLSFRSVSSPMKSPSQFDAKARPINRPYCIDALKNYGREEKIRDQIWAERERESGSDRRDQTTTIQNFPHPRHFTVITPRLAFPNSFKTRLFLIVPLSTNLLLFLSNQFRTMADAR